MKPGLVNSQVQTDAYQVIKQMVDGPPAIGPTTLMPTFGNSIGLPLKQDLKDILTRYNPPKKIHIDVNDVIQIKGLGYYANTPSASSCNSSVSPRVDDLSDDFRIKAEHTLSVNMNQLLNQTGNLFTHKNPSMLINNLPPSSLPPQLKTVEQRKASKFLN